MHVRKQKNILQIAIAIVCLTLTLSFATTQVKSGPLLGLPDPWKDYVVDPLLNKAVDWFGEKVASKAITDEMIEGTANSISYVITTASEKVVMNAVYAIGPSLFVFDGIVNENRDLSEMAKSGSGPNSHSSFDESTFTGSILLMSQTLGAVIAILAFFCGLLTYALKQNVTEIKDTPGKLCIRMIIAAWIIYTGHTIANRLLIVFNKLWDQFIVGEYKFSIDSAMIVTIVDDTAVKIFGQNLTLKSPVYTPVMVVIGLYFTWKIIKAFFKLLLAVYQRYILTCLFVYITPVVGGTVVSSNTIGVIIAFIKLYISQIVLLFMNAIFVMIYWDLMIRGVFVKSLLNYIFGISMAAVFLRFDSYIASMGINVAQMGMGVMQASHMGAVNMARDLGMLNNARKNVGGGMAAAGVAFGKQGMYDAGMLIGAGKGGTQGLSEVSKSINDPGFAQERFEKARADAGFSNDDAGNAQQRMSDTMNRANEGGNRQQNAFDAWQGYSNDAKHNALESQLSKLYGEGNDVKLDSFDDRNIKDGSVSVNMDVNGKKVSGQITNQQGKNGVAMGNGLYYHANTSNLRAANGSKQKFENSSQLKAEMISNGTYAALQKTGKAGEEAFFNRMNKGGYMTVQTDADGKIKGYNFQALQVDKNGGVAKNKYGNEQTRSLADYRAGNDRMYFGSDLANEASGEKFATYNGQQAMKNDMAEYQKHYDKSSKSWQYDKDEYGRKVAQPSSQTACNIGAQEARMGESDYTRAADYFNYDPGTVKNVQVDNLTGSTSFEAQDRDTGQWNAYTGYDVVNGGQAPQIEKGAKAHTFDTFGGLGAVKVVQFTPKNTEPTGE